jgi:deoxyribonuclease (pyrimidine dimer)
MTRINANIAPKHLSDNHLRAEFREIKRLHYLSEKWDKKKPIDIPETFTLGKGHIKFFYDKPNFIYGRYNELLNELRNREMFIDINRDDEFEEYFKKQSNEISNKSLYKDELKSNKLVVERIIDKMIAKLQQRPNYQLYYYGKPESPAETIKRLLNSLI